MSNEYLTIDQIIGNKNKCIKGVYPCSTLNWFKGCAIGRFPKPVVLGPKHFVWRRVEIEKLVERETKDPGGLSWLLDKQEKLDGCLD